MANYNPRIPYILGQEWVPIRQETVTMSPASRSLEVGHGFNLATSKILQDMRFYIADFPKTVADGQVLLMAIYPAGTEDATGPIRKVIIPCNNGGVTGTAGPTVGPAGGATTFADGVADPSDGKYVGWYLGGSPVATLSAFFATNSYSALLTGKRILSVNLLYSLTGPVANAADQNTYVAASIRNNAGQDIVYGSGFLGTFPVDNDDTFSNLGFNVYRMPIGEIDFFWDSSLSPFGTSERLPYTYTALQRFEASGSPRRSITLQSTNSSTTAFGMNVNYLALEVFFCEEQRTVIGGRSFGSSLFLDARFTPYVLNTNILPARSIAQALNPTLAAGDYTVVLSSADVGTLYAELSGRSVKNLDYPPISALRERYEIPGIPGVQVNLPFPMNDNALGKTFTRESTVILPQLSVHTSGGPLTEVHVYGEQVRAPVYSTITATQEILDSVVTAKSWPWVRFYARRFADTTSPLLLSSASPTVSGTCVRVQITPQEFDDLDEIVDGWKEVTLRFPCAPTMGGAANNPRWDFSASTETAGNRWEVLGARAPALSGIPGNLLQNVNSPHRLSTATYGAPNSGSTTINMGWLSPTVTVTTDDVDADAFLIFSVDMPTVTGFTVSGASQAVSGIGQNCGLDPCCIPTAILYNRLTWPIPQQLGVLYDTFTRTEANGWGSADSGQAWTASGGVAANYSVNGTTGLMSLTPTSTTHAMISAASFENSDMTVTLSTATVNGQTFFLYARYTDVNNHYLARINIGSEGTVSVRILRLVGGVTGFISSQTNSPLTVFDGDLFKARFTVYGNTLSFKVWDADQEEPDVYNLVAYDSSFTSGLVGVAASNSSTAPTVATFDDLLVQQPYVFGDYELQRMDTVETEWKTIMSATSPAVVEFNDYEARVGIESSYRIRVNNVYDFPGLWSDTVTIAQPSPGVSGGCVSQGHVLIFTSNERQDGSTNLAYASVWEGRVEENFTFPEAGFVQLQAMYNRDFFTAFRPLERGGEQFSRTVLVQAAAISPETLADFTSLRDMAWDAVPYICVRDEDGNRWFATVMVPTGRVLRDRRLYLAAVNVVEVTDTPSPVDPA